MTSIQQAVQPYTPNPCYLQNCVLKQQTNYSLSICNTTLPNAPSWVTLTHGPSSLYNQTLTLTIDTTVVRSYILLCVQCTSNDSPTEMFSSAKTFGLEIAEVDCKGTPASAKPFPDKSLTFNTVSTTERLSTDWTDFFQVDNVKCPMRYCQIRTYDCSDSLSGQVYFNYLASYSISALRNVTSGYSKAFGFLCNFGSSLSVNSRSLCNTFTVTQSPGNCFGDLTYQASANLAVSLAYDYINPSGVVTNSS